LIQISRKNQKSVISILNNRKIRISCSYWQRNCTLEKKIIDNILEEIRTKHIESRGKGITLSNSPPTGKLFSRNTIKQDGRSASRQNISHPHDKSVNKTLASKNLNNGIMLNGIKSLGKIQFENNYGLLGHMALVKILKIPGNTILNRSGFEESTLIFMNAIQNPSLESICHQFSEEF
jgi:hypothetical protein